MNLGEQLVCVSDCFDMFARHSGVAVTPVDRCFNSPTQTVMGEDVMDQDL